MERYDMFLDWKNQYYQNDYTIQHNLQIQCNPYQITNGIFTELEQKFLQFTQWLTIIYKSTAQVGSSPLSSLRQI